jgi:tetratricopeptide (TPR) repeat protein
MAVRERRYRPGRRAARLPPIAPTLPAALLGVGVVVALGAAGGGYEPKTWYPAALFLLALLAVALVARPGGGRPPPAVLAAVGLLAGYAVWSHLSIAWADDQGAAVQGAGRALLYAVVLALFALWPLDGRSAYVVVGAFGLGVAGLGLVELLELAAASEPAGSFIDRRLSEPVGYHNANVALWSLGLWPCVVLAARREVPPPLRALALAGGGLLLGLALMGQSRGWFFSLPVVLAFLLAVVPGRARAAVTLVALGVAALAMAGPVLDVHDSFTTGDELNALVDDAARAILLASAVLGALGLAVALVDRRAEPRPALARAAGRAVAVLAAVALAAGAVAWIARTGDPVDTVSDAWQEFKRGELPRAGESRFTASLGSGRYDIWRVAWDRFEEEPLTGIGADNFQQDYLRRGRTLERPVHPHSLEIRTLSQTGVVGGLLLLGAIAAAGVAAVTARRRAGALAAAPVAAALTVFAYWLVHGSVDWFWEIPALGAGAFAMLGVAAAAAPRPECRAEQARGLRVAAIAATGLALLLAGVVLGLGWLSERRVQRAFDIWRTDPAGARAELDAAADLNPWSSEPALVAGTIAVERGELALARREFLAALERDPREHYAVLELGAIASQLGDRRAALARLREAARLSPRDRVTAVYLRAIRRGERVDARELGDRLLAAARQVAAPD